MPFYHLSTKDLGPVAMLKPSVVSDYDGERERRQRAICVCPSVMQCLKAVPWRVFPEVMFIYELDDDVIPVKASWIADFPQTNEHRIFRKARFKLLKRIDFDAEL